MVEASGHFFILLTTCVYNRMHSAKIALLFVLTIHAIYDPVPPAYQRVRNVFNAPMQ